jgi:hypothetical protein
LKYDGNGSVIEEIKVPCHQNVDLNVSFTPVRLLAGTEYRIESQNDGTMFLRGYGSYDTLNDSWNVVNFFNGVGSLPFDAIFYGSNVTLGCTSNWTQNAPTQCNGIFSSYIISYSDLNMCNVSTNLPVNNGSNVSCCVEHFVQNNTACTGYSFVAGYIDLNHCGTSYTLPSDNGLTLPCTLEARNSGTSNGRSEEIVVVEENVSDNLITGSVTSPVIFEEPFLTRLWDAFVEWISGWWNS